MSCMSVACAIVSLVARCRCGYIICANMRREEAALTYIVERVSNGVLFRAKAMV